MQFTTYSFRFAEEVLNSKLSLKKEVEDIMNSLKPDYHTLTRPEFNKIVDVAFQAKGWTPQPLVFNEPGDPSAKMDFLKERIGVEVGFGHSSVIGIDLLKFQVSSYSALNNIDVGIYIVTTREFQRVMKRDYGISWGASLTFQKVERYLPHFKSAIQVPVWVVGIGP
ncbi:BglII/BstYI family type II restriction endonuclease [Chloroflexota bacterium]